MNITSANAIPCTISILGRYEFPISASSKAWLGRDLNKEELQGLFREISAKLQPALQATGKAPAEVSVVVHGGAAIVSSLGSRLTTRDVDYLASPFDRALEKVGVDIQALEHKCVRFMASERENLGNAVNVTPITSSPVFTVS